ncbi:MAG: NAD+ synthase, partial [Microgenomates group bacterium LiPW_16]
MFKDFNPKETAQNIIKFLRQEVREAGFGKVIIPLSGGVDSAVAACLAVRALGPGNVLIARLPHKDLNQDNDANLVITRLKIPKTNIFETEISEIIKAFVTTSIYRYMKVVPKKETEPGKLRLGNIMARVRMIILYDLAKKHNALVCGTENKSEYLLGYFTRFGDEASDFEP